MDPFRVILLMSVILNVLLFLYGQHYKDQALVQQGQISELRQQIENVNQAEKSE